MENKHLKLFLEDMSFATDYEFLEEGKHDDELKEIASKRGLTLPSKDLAIFKGRYAFANRKNKNGCTLPAKEVRKSLQTLTGKAVDKDHLRKSTVGFWLDSDLQDEEIISYGAFWKSNFPEDYEEIKKRMKEGKLKISFEAWGDRVMKENGSYDLTNIEFAGGALLFDTQPAFDGAEVLDFASINNRVLEFAKIMDEKESKEINMDKPLTEAKLDFYYDSQVIGRMMSEAICTFCNKKGWFDINSIDLDKLKVESTCMYCGAKADIDLTPDVTITKKGKKLARAIVKANIDIDKIEDFEGTDEDLEMTLSSMLEGDELITEDNIVMEEAKKLTFKERKNINDDNFAVVVTIKNKKTGEPRKIRMFPIHDSAHVRNALARLSQATETLKKLGVSVDSVKRKILKRAKELKMTDLLKRHEKGGNELMDELLKKYAKATVEELAPFLDKELEITKASVKTVEDDFLKAIEESAESLKMCMNTKMKDGMKSKDAFKECIKMMKSSLDEEIATLKAKVTEFEAEKAKVEKEKKDALIKSRRDELTEEFAKDLKDEDIIDDVKFELAKAKKEIAKLKAGKPASAGLEAGAELKDKDNPSFTKQTNIQKKAFGE